MGETVLQERFVIQETLTEDKVYRAADLARGNSVLLKKWQAADPFGQQEAALLSALSHTGLPQLICSFEDKGCRYLAEEWIEGETLEAYVQHSGGSLSTAEAIHILTALCDIIGYLHKKAYVYLDLKPTNVICSRAEKETAVRLIDFESVQTAAPAEASETFSVSRTICLGTEYFTAPEVLYGAPCVASDLFSIGAVMAYMLTGSPVLDPEFRFSGDLRRILNTCLQPDARLRYRSVELLMADISKCTEEKTQPIGNPEAASAHQSARGSLARIKWDGYRRTVAMVDCNLCFACELAYAAAKGPQFRTILFELPGYAESRIRYFLEIEEDASFSDHYHAVMEDTPFRQIYGIRPYFHQNIESWLAKGWLGKCRTAPGLYVAGADLFREISVDTAESARQLCDWAYSRFDLILFSADNRSGRETQLIMPFCDYFIAVPESNIDAVADCRDYLTSLSNSGYLVMPNVRYAAWDYQDSCSLTEKGIVTFLGERKYIGAVRYDPERLSCRNRKSKFYCSCAYQKFAPEYERILYHLMVRRRNTAEEAFGVHS